MSYVYIIIMTILSGFIITLSYSQETFAQTEKAVNQTEVYTMDDIIVTPQKLEENIREVPVTIQAFTDEYLHISTTRHLGDLAPAVPGLTVHSFSTTQPGFSIRGIGHSDFSIGTDSPVGIYLDGVYSGRSGSALMNLTDIERVEILKGPQGVLFGRSAAGGAINVIPKKPTSHSEGNLLLRYGNYNKRQVELMLNIPILKNLFFRINGLYNARDGFYKNEAGGDDLETEGNKTLRGSLLWKPGNSTRIFFTTDYDDTDQDGSHTISINPDLSVGRGDPFGKIANDVSESKETRILKGYTLNCDHYFELFSLQSITTQTGFETENREDSDGLANIEHYLDTHNFEKNRQFYQELRLTGDTTRYDWFLAASYLKESASQTHRVNTSSETINMATGSPLLPTGMFWTESLENKGENTSISVFGNLTRAITNKLDLGFGVRYSRDEKEFQWIERQNSLGFPSDIIFPNGPDNLAVTRENTWENWSFRLVIGYDITSDLYTYASATNGYKAGGFGGLEINSEYEPETVDNYEAGAKAIWFNKTLQTNFSFFYYKYKDRQFMQYVKSSGDPAIPLFIPVNGDMKGQGCEVETTWKAAKNLKLFLNTGYTDIRWADYTTPAGHVKDGQHTGEAPFDISTGLDYSYISDNAGVVRVHINHSYTKYQYRRIDGKSKKMTNARLTWFLKKNYGEVSLWGKNLSDEESLSRINGAWQETLDTTFVARNDPRTFGIDYRYQF